MEMQYIGAYVLVLVPALVVALGFCRAAAQADRHMEQHIGPHDYPSRIRHQGRKRPTRRRAMVPRGTMAKRLYYGPQ